MTIFLRQSTASQEIPLGYFVDSVDGNTEETALTIANTDIKIWKTGATTLANKNSGGGTHISNGVYYAVLDATDTDTIGPLRAFIHVAGALAVKVDCVVLDEAVYDALFGTTALATATNITAGTITNVTTVNGLAANVITAAAVATGAIDADAIAADAITDAKVASDVTIASVTGAVGSVTGNVGGTVAGFTTAAKAEIESEVNDALVVQRLDELVNADSDIDGAAPPTVGSVIHELMSKTAGSFTFDQTTDSNEAIRDNMGTVQTGDAFARLGAPAGASVSADIAALKAEAEAMIIKKNTALSNFEFLMIDSIDHVSPKTGLTITATRSIDGAAFGACTNSASEVSNGVYKINLSASDLNGDVITFKFTGTGADQITITIITQA